MINLLPPEIKSEIAFSKYNTALIKLMATILAAGSVLLITLFVGSRNQASRVDVLEKQNVRRAADVQLETTLKSVNEKVKTISTVKASKHHFSAFLRDFAAALPGDASINNLDLNSQTTSIKLTVNVGSNSSTSQLKDSLTAVSARISSVEVESITQSETGFDVVLIITLKPEAFK